MYIQMRGEIMSKKWMKRRKRIFEIIEVGNDLDRPSRIYDFVNVFAMIVNLLVGILCTYAELVEQYGLFFHVLEHITVAFFAIDYLLRVCTARFLYKDLNERHAIRRYMCSFFGVVDLLSFLPFYLPFFFPAGSVAFRMIRIVRIFRLFKINAYYDSLNVITEVVRGKKQQLISSVFIIAILMTASSLCMYSLEHEAQPEVFANAFSGIWWATSTLFTIGYGDIYPITLWGKILSILITILGAGMVAIPTGIISAGFVDQYSHIQKRAEYGYKMEMNFIRIRLQENDKWVGRRIKDLQLPQGIIVAVIKRREEVIIPRGDVVLLEDDTIVLGSEPFEVQDHIKLQEIILEERNPWVGVRIRDLDISRHSIIVLVKRRNKSLIPNGSMVLRDGDKVFLYSKLHLANVGEVEL